MSEITSKAAQPLHDEMPSSALTDDEIEVLLDCMEALESLAERGGMPTPAALRALLDPDNVDPTVTLELIAWALTQLQAEEEVTQDEQP